MAKGEGHNPIRAVGVLLCHLAHICHHTQPGTAQIWRLRVAQKNPEGVHDYLEKIAEKAKMSVHQLFASNRLPPSQLAKGLH